MAGHVACSLVTSGKRDGRRLDRHPLQPGHAGAGPRDRLTTVGRPKRERDPGEPRRLFSGGQRQPASRKRRPANLEADPIIVAPSPRSRGRGTAAWTRVMRAMSAASVGLPGLMGSAPPDPRLRAGLHYVAWSAARQATAELSLGVGYCRR